MQNARVRVCVKGGRGGGERAMPPDWIPLELETELFAHLSMPLVAIQRRCAGLRDPAPARTTSGTMSGSKGGNRRCQAERMDAPPARTPRTTRSRSSSIAGRRQAHTGARRTPRNCSRCCPRHGAKKSGIVPVELVHLAQVPCLLRPLLLTGGEIKVPRRTVRRQARHAGGPQIQRG